MRDKKNRLALQKVFVLGAGASYSASQTARGGAATTTPLDKDFCERIVSLDIKRPKWVAESQGLLLKNWRDHLAFEDSGLEAAIIRHLSHLQFFAAIDKRRAGKNALTAAEYVNHMAHLIAYVLKRSKENDREVLRELAGIVFPPSRLADDEHGANRIITFNYDTLLDDYLLNRFSPQALYFDKIKNEPGGPNRRSRYVAYPLLVKLHGSVNWRCSTDEFGRIVDTHTNNDGTCRIEEIWCDGTGTPTRRIQNRRASCRRCRISRSPGSSCFATCGPWRARICMKQENWSFAGTLCQRPIRWPCRSSGSCRTRI